RLRYCYVKTITILINISVRSVACLYNRRVYCLYILLQFRNCKFINYLQNTYNHSIVKELRIGVYTMAYNKREATAQDKMPYLQDRGKTPFHLQLKQTD